MLIGLADRVVVVTGAGRGIGAAVSRRLVAEGARVVVADLDGDAAARLATELGPNATAVGADVTTVAGNDACVDTAVTAFGQLDAFHANAGIAAGVGVTLDETDPETLRRVLEVNVVGAFLGARAAVRRFAVQGGGGSVLFTASLAGLRGAAGSSAYVASKHAVLGIMKSLALEVGGSVRVNALAPALVETDMSRAIETDTAWAAGKDVVEVRANMHRGLPYGRYATVDEIAATAAWILSDEVPYLHGETVTVTGGRAA